METTMRGKLHSFLEVLDDEKLEAFYILMKDEIDNVLPAYNEQDKAELLKRKKDYKNGSAELINEIQSKERIRKLFNTKAQDKSPASMKKKRV